MSGEPLPIHITVQPGWDSLLGAYHQLEMEILQKLEKPHEAVELLALSQDLSRMGGLLARVGRDCLYLARKRLEFVGRNAP